MLKIIGGIIIAWGVLDFGLSWMGTDLYGEIGIIIPEPIWNYTSYIAGIIGVGLIALGNKMGHDATQNDE